MVQALSLHPLGLTLSGRAEVRSLSKGQGVKTHFPPAAARHVVGTRASHPCRRFPDGAAFVVFTEAGASGSRFSGGDRNEVEVEEEEAAAAT